MEGCCWGHEDEESVCEESASFSFFLENRIIGYGITIKKSP